MLTKATCQKCGALTPHRTLYIRSWAGSARTWKEAFLACTVCKTPYHLKRPEYTMTKYTGDERFDRILRQAATPLDINVLRKRLGEAGQTFTESGLLDALAYLQQNGFVEVKERDHTSDVLNQVEVTKNFGTCVTCHKDSVITLYSMRNRRFVVSGTVCVTCGTTTIEDLGE